MPIGDSFKYLQKGPLRYLTTFIGTPDIHSHIRIKPLIKYFKENFKKSNVRIVEVGCGNGINAFELLKENERIEYYGFDLDEDSIRTAKDLSNILGYGKLNFFLKDVQNASFEELNGKIDIILLMDVLEHLEKPEELLRGIGHLLDEETRIIVSVPTPRYKEVFGEQFHESIGHLRDGFTLSELEGLMKKVNYKIEYYSYNTGYPSSIGCFAYYRFFPSNRYLNLLKVLLLYPFRFLDIYNSEKISCSIFAVCRRNNNSS